MENNNVMQNPNNFQPIQNVQPVQTTKPAAPPIPLKEAVFACVFFALSFVYTYFACGYAGGLWGGIFWIIFGIINIVYFKSKKIKLGAAETIILVSALTFGLTPLFSGSIFINILAAIFSFLLYIYLFAVISGAEPFGARFAGDAFFAVFAKPFVNFPKFPKAAASLFRGKNRAKNLLFALIGLVCAVPLTIVVVALLILSDDVFENALFDAAASVPATVFKIIWSLIAAVPVAMYLYGALQMTAAPHEKKEGAPAWRVMPPIIGCAAITPACGFYLFYIIIQISRIFDKTSLGTPESYSAFARRGFFELCLIAVINLGVIVIMQSFSKRREGDKKPLSLKIFTTVLCVLTLGIIATALAKMFMYIDKFGMTLLRVYTSWFMILLALVFMVVIISQFVSFRFFRAIFGIFAAMMLVLCFSNTEGIIANYNVSAYQTGKIETFDAKQLRELGYAGVAPAVELYDSLGEKDEKLKRDLADYFERVTRDDEYFDNFAYFSLPRANAKSSLERAKQIVIDDYEIMN